MPVLKCPVCGGELEVNSDLTVGVCKFCDSTIVIPKELDRKGNLYNRAVFLRQNNEFDKAVATYEDILKEDNSDAEAHWGLVLSKYGIEYVTDPRTNQHVPTCHRTQAQSILSDPDYLAALEYSDSEVQRVIGKEAKRISEIQTKILEISRKEPPYDIFICYKESDEFGNRTEDSILAQELYYELVKKGYKVFFARKTLESKIGTEYEPVIYAALNSAKVMIVLGTKPDNFNAVWVRNEWIRFMRMEREDSDKTIIPAYRGMSPYELPTELSSLQSQDMSKIGFMQDLTDGIERCMRGETRKEAIEKETSDNTYGAASLERLLQIAETYLKLNDYSEAEEIYKRITKEYPESYTGWWGLIICSTDNLSRASSSQSDVDKWFDYVKTLCVEFEYSSIECQYVDYLKLVAEVDAWFKINTINATIRDCENNIADEQQNINQAEQSKRDLYTSHKAYVENEREILRKLQVVIYRKRGFWEMVIPPAACVGGVAMGGLGLLLLVALVSEWSSASGFEKFVFIGITLFLLYISIWLFVGALAFNNDFKQSILDAQDNFRKEKEQAIIRNEQYQKERNEQDRKIGIAEAYIDAETEKIELLERFIEEKQESLNRYFHSVRCAKIGVKVNFNEDISLPSLVSGVHNEEQFNLICPACGSQITAEQGETREQGVITCSVCGKEIEVVLNK